MSFARKLQKSAWDAECRRDMHALLAHFEPDATFYPAGGPPQRGHAAIEAMTNRFYSAYKDLQIDLLQEWNRGEACAIFEFRAHVTDYEGARSTIDGVCAVEIHEGRFASVRYYEDAPSREA